MKPSVWVKQPWEERLLEFDTATSLSTGDSISSVDSVKVFYNGLEQVAMISGSPTISGNKVRQKIVGGTNGSDYVIRVRVVTTNGDKIEDELTMKVRDT
jgi:hypothetical protein